MPAHATHPDLPGATSPVPEQQPFTHAILAARRGAQSLRILNDIAEFLRQRNIEYYPGPDREGILEKPENRAHRSALRKGGLGIVVGGDGTMLLAARMMAPHEIPLTGINTGRLGFLTDVPPENMQNQLEAILQGTYLEERRIILQCRATRRGKLITEQSAINEIAIQKWDVSRLFSYEVKIDGALLYRQRGDGVIIATPTGSTAYSLAAGGPLLFPTMEAFSLVPVCPHVLSNRPIVLTSNHRVEIAPSPTESEHATLTCDGYLGAELLPGDTVEVTAAPYRLRLIHPAGHNHFDTLRAKLGWGK